MTKYLIKTFVGLESVLADELSALGATDIQAVGRGVICTGNEKLMYRANLELRTGLRVYRHLADIDARTPDDLYYSVGAYDWAKHLEPHGTIWVTSTAGQTDWVQNTMIVSLKTKDAIVDKLRIGETRPSVDKDRPDLRIHTYVHNGEGSIWLDSTGDPLFKRGYRLRTMDAPINEVLAAGILRLAGYDGSTPLVDPMCGSGTFGVEAARIALNIPSQNERQFFAFMNWPDFDRATWTMVRQQALSRIHRGEIAPIIISDIERRAMRYAENNVREAGLANKIELHEADFFDVSAPFDEGIVVLNPPYDERLALHDGIRWYKEVGSTLKHRWADWDAWMVSGFIDGMYAMSLTPKKKLPLDNGGIPVELWQIPLYKGSKRIPGAHVSPDAATSDNPDDDD